MREDADVGARLWPVVETEDGLDYGLELARHAHGSDATPVRTPRRAVAKETRPERGAHAVGPTGEHDAPTRRARLSDGRDRGRAQTLPRRRDPPGRRRTAPRTHDDSGSDAAEEAGGRARRCPSAVSACAAERAPSPRRVRAPATGPATRDPGSGFLSLPATLPLCVLVAAVFGLVVLFEAVFFETPALGVLLEAVLFETPALGVLLEAVLFETPALGVLLEAVLLETPALGVLLEAVLLETPALGVLLEAVLFGDSRLRCAPRGCAPPECASRWSTSSSLRRRTPTLLV